MECLACHNSLVDDAAYCPRCGTRQPHVAECDTYDYAAFISYRHRSPDRDVAERLHRAIEEYRLPAPIAAAYGSAKVGRVFRDQDELPATSSLPTAIRQALRHARTLVVVCSTETPSGPWIQQEIELFASYHGRDRIFAVLAEGASAASLPESLRFVTRIAPDGTPERIAAEPLAADMRTAVGNAFEREKLRVIAAIAGCSLDDLRQREQSRRRKRIAIGVGIALAVAAVIGIFAGQAALQREASLVEESKRLAVESQQLLAHGDRYEAIEAALQALPASSQDTSRPLVPEAQEALEAALQVHLNDAAWLSSYSLNTENPLGILGLSSSFSSSRQDYASFNSAIAVCESMGYFAVGDTAGQISTYDTHTGKRLATCQMPGNSDDAGRAHNLLQATGNGLLVSNLASRLICCFDPFTGDVLWSSEWYSASALNAPLYDEVAVVSSTFSDGSIKCALFATADGRGLAETDSLKLDLPVSSVAESALGETPYDCYLAVESKLALINLKSGEAETVSLAYPNPTSLSFQSGTLVACSVSAFDGVGGESEEDARLSYAIEAFDADLTPLWQRNGTIKPKTIQVSSGESSLVIGSPMNWGYLSDENRSVVISAGQDLFAVNPQTGEATREYHYQSPVLTARPAGSDDGETNLLFVACSDGDILVEDASAAEKEHVYTFYDGKADEQLRWSRVAFDAEGATWLSISAEEPGRIVAYRLDASGESAAERDYTLDELIELADDTLARR